MMTTGGSIPRREFLLQTSALGAAGLIALTATPLRAASLLSRGKTIPRRDGRIMLDKVTLSVFADSLNTTFCVRSDQGEPQTMTLVEAASLGQAPDRGDDTQRRGPFSLVFRGPAEPILSQKTYTFKHASLGTFDIFIVPIGPDEHGMRYEAVFN